MWQKQKVEPVLFADEIIVWFVTEIVCTQQQSFAFNSNRLFWCIIVWYEMFYPCLIHSILLLGVLCIPWDFLSKGKGKNVAYNEWEHKKHGTSWKQQIRLEIDRLIATAKNIDDLLYQLELSGYSVKRGKYISIKVPEQQRFVRTKTLGEDYTEESIASRILWRDVGSDITLSGEPAPIRSEYLKAINEVGELKRFSENVSALCRIPLRTIWMYKGYPPSSLSSTVTIFIP